MLQGLLTVLTGRSAGKVVSKAQGGDDASDVDDVSDPSAVSTPGFLPLLMQQLHSKEVTTTPEKEQVSTEGVQENTMKGPLSSLLKSFTQRVGSLVGQDSRGDLITGTSQQEKTAIVEAAVKGISVQDVVTPVGNATEGIAASDNNGSQDARVTGKTPEINARPTSENGTPAKSTQIPAGGETGEKNSSSVLIPLQHGPAGVQPTAPPESGKVSITGAPHVEPKTSAPEISERRSGTSEGKETAATVSNQKSVNGDSQVQRGGSGDGSHERSTGDSRQQQPAGTHRPREAGQISHTADPQSLRTALNVAQQSLVDSGSTLHDALTVSVPGTHHDKAQPGTEKVERTQSDAATQVKTADTHSGDVQIAKDPGAQPVDAHPAATAPVKGENSVLTPVIHTPSVIDSSLPAPAVQHTPAALPPDIAQSVLDQVARELARRIGDQGSEIKLHLKPETLGELALKVKLENGSMSAQIDVSHASVKAALEANLADLRAALQSRGIDVRTIDVYTQSNSSSENGGQNSPRSSSNGRRHGATDIVERYQRSRQMGYNTIELVI